MGLSHFIKLVKKIGLSTILFLAIPASIVEAQITPDGTLESTVQQIQELMKINGGLREGNNLFHSFENFNIPEGMEAAFENATDIENIFTRVTGDSASEIFGTLSANGGANFFLMNPNGIVFGENASINVGGSFMATTADSIEFEDGTSFAANDTNADPVLTTDQPSGFTFDGQPGAIEVYGEGSEIDRKPDIAQFAPFSRGDRPNGLTVKTEKTLALVGGEINIEGGNLSTESGHIELGSVGTGEVELSSEQSELSFDYKAVSDFGNINLSEKASADASGSGSGSIGVSGSNVKLTDGSVFLIQNSGDTPSGNIDFNASQSLILSGAASNQTVSSIASETIGDGNAANIRINAQDLLLQNGGNITSATFSVGEGGDVNVNASNSARLFRTPEGTIDRASSRIASLTYGTGDSGNVFVSTSSLKASTGGTITSGSASPGNGGSINIQADSIEMNGTTDEDGLFTAFVAGTFGTGDAGSLTIDTSRLKILNGASIAASSRNNGAAGNITINASEQIEISGSDPNSATPSTINSSVTLEQNEVFREALSLPPVPNGRAGDLNINTPLLSVDSGADISVRNEGSGNAGKLSIDAENVNLNDSGTVNATSASGQGGNIELNTDNLQLENQSQVTATTENQGQGGNVNINARNISAKKDSAISANADGGDGGNITIDTATITGSGNSDITANAVDGDGGNIDLSAKFIVGFEERAELTPLNDIVASSEFGQSGTININAPETDAQEDPNVNALKPEDVEAGELLKAVCPNPDNRYGKKTFRYVDMRVAA